ncbi:MAG TPA: PIN domain-containing protein [Pseudomonadota bacterium]|jgi:predicted nucleic acid-binding protein|nr:PIN domain-containing protein [Piscinibacter sp.]HPH29932.1 PIN domain-containing protein [Pseudomonadota bacterium]
MAGHARYTALLDACVLYPMAMADALMSLATAGLFAAKWTTRIEAEWIRSLEENRPDLQGRLDYRREQMREAVPDWEVDEQAWTICARGLELPDPDDVHVLASALAGHADCIVTANLKDFPAEVVAQLGIEVIHPDQFIVVQWDLDQLVAVAAFKRMRARWKQPQASAEDFAAAMERGGLPATAQRLREAAELI